MPPVIPAAKVGNKLQPTAAPEESEHVRNILRNHATNHLEWSAEQFNDTLNSITRQTMAENKVITHAWLSWEALRRTWENFCE
jgi:hypothetical protein